MTTPTPDDLIRRLTGDDPEEAIPDALADMLRRLVRIEEKVDAIEEDLGEVG